MVQVVMRAFLIIAVLLAVIVRLGWSLPWPGGIDRAIWDRCCHGVECRECEVEYNVDTALIRIDGAPPRVIPIRSFTEVHQLNAGVREYCCTRGGKPLKPDGSNLRCLFWQPGF